MSPIKHITLTLLAALSLPLSAQKVYTLDECRQMALENNVKARNAANSLEAAEQTKKEAFTNYFPTVSATGMGFVANEGLVNMSLMGMSVEMLKDGMLGSVTLTQPLFAGGQIVNGNKLAEVGVTVSQAQKQMTEDEVRLTVETYYWNVVMLQEKLVTIKAVEDQLSNIAKDAEAAVKAGVSNQNDLLQVQLKANDIESARLTLENNLSICRMILAQYVGLGADSIAVASDISVDQTPEFPSDLLCDHNEALRQTPTYALLESNVKATRLQQKMTTGKHLPTVAVGASCEVDNLMDEKHSAVFGFATVSIPLSGWWGGSHAIKKQKLDVANAENSLSDNSQLLVIGMQKAWNDLEESYKQILVAHKSIDQSAESLRLNKDYYHAGTSTMTDLLNAQTSYQQSRDKYVDAYAQFQLKKAQYLQATGR